MANTTIYPYGLSSQEPSGIISQKLEEIQSTLDLLGDWAFIEIPNPANPIYHRVSIFPTASAGIALLRCGLTSSLADYVMSPMFDLGEIGTPYSLRFSAGVVVATGQYPGLVYFDENMEPYSYHVANSNPRTVSGTVSSTIKYVRLLFSFEHIFDAYLYNTLTEEYLFVGENTSLPKIKDEEHFKRSKYWLNWGPNDNGDWIGWNFAASNTASTNQRNDINYPMFRNIGVNASDWSYGISRIIELPENTTISIEFSCGAVNTDLMLRLLNPSEGTANYYSANANPRTVSINTVTYTHVQLYFLTADYANCYIKDATNNEMLWQGSSS